MNFEIVFINFCALSTAKGMTVNMKQIKNMLFTSKIYSSTGLTVQELNVLSYITLLTSALKEATLKIDQLQLNVLTLDQEVRLLKERNDSTNAE